jgi:hypothetical protein
MRGGGDVSSAASSRGLACERALWPSDITGCQQGAWRSWVGFPGAQQA